MRQLWEIAKDIKKHWPSQSFAKPYVDAMSQMTHIHSKYGIDSAEEIVNRFLSNSAGFRGDIAKKIKKELKEMLKSV